MLKIQAEKYHLFSLLSINIRIGDCQWEDIKISNSKGFGFPKNNPRNRKPYAIIACKNKMFRSKKSAKSAMNSKTEVINPIHDVSNTTKDSTKIFLDNTRWEAS